MMHAPSAISCVQATVLIAGLAGALTWGEFVYLQRISPKGTAPAGLSNFDRRAYVGLIAAIGLVGSLWAPEVQFWLLIALAFVTAAFARTTNFGREGSDEIALVIVVPLVLATSPGGGSEIRTVALFFIAAQLALAYFASGCAKAAGPKWRDGTAVAQILSTQDYGLGRRALYDADLPLFRAMAWGTIAFEIALPIAFVLGGPFAIPALVAGAAFHASIAVMMGLNRFFPWFLAAYPAVAWVSLHYGLLST